MLAVRKHAEIALSYESKGFEDPFAGLLRVTVLLGLFLRSLPRFYTCLSRILHIQWFGWELAVIWYRLG